MNRSGEINIIETECFAFREHAFGCPLHSRQPSQKHRHRQVHWRPVEQFITKFQDAVFTRSAENGDGAPLSRGKVFEHIHAFRMDR